MATTGSILAPCQAGKIPLINPIRLLIPTPRMMFSMVMYTEKSLETDMTVARINTISRPIIPPATDSMTDSKSNCSIIK